MTLRIGHTGDLHLSMSHKRWYTLARVLDRMLEQMADARVDLIVIPGDIGENHTTARDRDQISAFLTWAADVAAVAVVAGNHDSTADWPVFRRLHTRHPLALVDRPTTLAFTYGGEGRDEDLLDLEYHDPPPDPDDVRAVIHCMPWPAKGNLLRLLPKMPSPEESDAAVQACLRSIFTGFRAERERLGYTDCPSILAAHVEVGGAKVDSGQPMVSQSLPVSVHELQEVGADAVMLGHIHARQSVDERVMYSGSPCRLSWGEAGAESKGWYLWEFGGDPSWDAPVRVTDQNVPSPRLWTVEAHWMTGISDDILLYAPDNSPNGGWGYEEDRGETPATLTAAEGDDELRFRYHVPADQREAAKAAVDAEIKRIWPGRRELVTVEENVIASDHSRDPEIASESDPVEQARRYLRLEHPEWSDNRIEEYVPQLREAVRGSEP
jgi:exonuclease SbcD